MLVRGQSRMSVRDVFDHLLLGVSELDHGIDWVEKHTGVRPAIGGVHPGRGTRNALISLGGPTIWKSSHRTGGSRGWIPQFQINGLPEPRLIRFAVRTIGIRATAASLRRAGEHPIGPTDGSRRTASGALLHWKTLGLDGKFRSGPVDPIPFFIEWAKDSIHPSKTAPTGCVIEDLHFEHPRADELRGALRVMGLDADVAQAKQARIIALVKTLTGRAELT